MRSGYKGCSAPNCASKVGGGKMFRRFPQNENLASIWLAHLPDNFKVGSSTAFCEDHFDLQQFERPRADGSKKLKCNAVPKLFAHRQSGNNSPKLISVTKKVPFTDLTNVQETPKRPCVLKPSQIIRTIQQKELDSAHALLSLSNAEPMQIAVQMPEVPLVDEVTANVEPMQVAVELPEGPYLDEVTGRFIPGIDSPPPASPQPSQPAIRPTISIHEFLCRTDVTVESAIDFVLEQQKEIERTYLLLEEQQERMDSFEVILEEKIQEQVQVKGQMERKYVALAMRHSRLKAEYNRHTHSPYITPNQMKRLFRHSNRGIEWTSAEIKKGLVLKMKCGTKGYDSIAKEFHILPSVRILQQRVQFIEFKPGLLHNMLDLIRIFSKDLKDTEKDCQIVMDEMQLKNFSKHDYVLDRYIGKCTLKGHSGTATKALLVILAGISRRWKMSVAVEFTNKKNPQEWQNTTGEAYCELLNNVAQAAEEAGVRVCGITTDMGPDNQAFWNHFKLTGSKYAKLVHTVPNPTRPKDQIFILPDIVHLFKNAKRMLEVNKFLKLPESLVQEAGLASPFVHYSHLDDAITFEKSAELKVAYRLRPDNLHCEKHFSKMNVGTAKAVICQRSSTILKVMSEETKNRSYLTTAWFIETLNAFFDLVTCRHIGLAVTKSKPKAYEKAINLIRKVSFMFNNMEVGDTGEWKPVQRGFKILCASLLGLIDYFLNKRMYQFLMLGRFSSDCIENIFSLVRLLQALPDASTFLQNLKVITLSQFSEAVRGASYDYDECEEIEQYDFLEEARKMAARREAANDSAIVEEWDKYPFVKPTHQDYRKLGRLERQVVYDIAGSVVRAVKENRKVCNTCLQSVKWRSYPGGAEVHPMAEVSIMKEYSVLRTDIEAEEGEGLMEEYSVLRTDVEAEESMKEGQDKKKVNRRLLQIYVSDTVYQAILTAEVAFRLNRRHTMNFEHAKVKDYLVRNLMYVWEDCDISNCHEICYKMLSVYLGKRLKQYSSFLREKAKMEENDGPQYGSKSVVGHHLAANVGKKKRGGTVTAKGKKIYSKCVKKKVT